MVSYLRIDILILFVREKLKHNYSGREKKGMEGKVLLPQVIFHAYVRGVRRAGRERDHKQSFQGYKKPWV